ncbi:hypothetical protein HZC00_03560 [Candidatus Kaiserbacteria bacterium]|nr:hypothetical protein [Candidatus Kaiserbacteria bacterium]
MMKCVITGFVVAFMSIGSAVAEQQYEADVATSQEMRQMARNRQAMTKDALAPALSEQGKWQSREWMFVVGYADVKVTFHKLGYVGCGYIHLQKTGYVPVCNYRSVYDMLTSKDQDQINEAITLIEIYAMHAGLIPYGQPDSHD